jgi:hypothetical protein
MGVGDEGVHEAVRVGVDAASHVEQLADRDRIAVRHDPDVIAYGVVQAKLPRSTSWRTRVAVNVLVMLPTWK